MPKITVFCLVKKKNMRVEKRVADLLVRKGRARYLTASVEPQTYETKVMVTEPVIEEVDAYIDVIPDIVIEEEQEQDEPVKRRGRPRKVKEDDEE